MGATTKKMAVKIAAAAMSVFMFTTVIATTAVNVMAAQPAESEIQSESALPAMTEVEMQMYVDEYLAELEQNDGSPLNPAGYVLDYLGGKVFDKFVDKALDSAFEAIFGKSGESNEVVDKLNEINGKLDKIIQMLEMVFKQLNIQAARESINKKNVLYNSIAAQTKNIDGLFKSSKGRENYKELRWAALKDWYKLRLGGNSNSITSMILFCDTLTDANKQSWGGNYFAQYKAYANLLWLWDAQRVPFETVQTERDIYIVAQMATYNLLYLQYAEDNGLEMDYPELRRQIGECLKSVQKTYNENKPEGLDPKRPILTYGDRSIQIYNETSFTLNMRAETKPRMTLDHKIWETEERWSQLAKIYGFADSHMMTNAERDWLMSVAKANNLSFNSMMRGATQFPEDVSLSTSVGDKGSFTPWHYGDRRGTGWRNTYCELLDTTGAGHDRQNTLVYRISVNDDDRIEPCNGESNWNGCVYEVDDHWKSEFEKQLEKVVFVYVVNSNKIDNYTAEDEQEITEDMTAEGTITQLKDLDDGGQITLATGDGQTLDLEYSNAPGGALINGVLAVGANVQVDYEHASYKGETVCNTPTQINVLTEEKTMQGTVINIDDANELVLAGQDGQNYTFARDEKTEINGNLQQSATVKVTYTEQPGGMYATQIVVENTPAPQPVPAPAPLPTPGPDPVPEPVPEPVPTPAPAPEPDLPPAHDDVVDLANNLAQMLAPQ